jgi:hypothetical protein
LGVKHQIPKNQASVLIKMSGGLSASSQGNSRAALKSAFASVGTRHFPGLTDEIHAVEFDTDDTCFVCTHNVLYSFSPNGTSAVVCGDPAAEPGFVDGNRNQARLNFPCRILLLGNKRMILSEPRNHALRMVFLETGIVKTIVGNGVAGISADITDGSAQLNWPSGICKNSEGFVFLADSLNHRIMRLEIADDWPETELRMTKYCGSGVPGHIDGCPDTCAFDSPVGLVIDHDDDMLIADCNNNAIRFVCKSCVETSTIAGANTDALSFRDGDLQSARFFFPVDIVVDRNNYVIIADRNNHCIRLIKSNRTGKNVITLAGRRSVSADNLVPLECQSIDGLSKKARFNLPSQLSFDNSGQLVVVCINNSGAVRIVNSLNSSFDPPRHTN